MWITLKSGVYNPKGKVFRSCIKAWPELQQLLPGVGPGLERVGVGDLHTTAPFGVNRGHLTFIHSTLSLKAGPLVWTSAVPLIWKPPLSPHEDMATFGFSLRFASVFRKNCP
jgi:hypothetical protein